MNRICFFISLLFYLTQGFLSAQSHISEAFVKEAEWVLEEWGDFFQTQGMVGCVHDNILYCCHRKGFQNKEISYEARVQAIDLQNGEQMEIRLPFPEKKATPSMARRYWIRGISTDGVTLVVSVQNGLLLYHKGRNERYVLERKIPFELPDKVLYNQDELSVIERVPEEGRFVLKRCKRDGSLCDSVCGFQLPAPFMLQYEPNGFLKFAGDNLFFLASPELCVNKYTKMGEKIEEIHPSLPEWFGIPGALAKKISGMPYGSDRAMYAFFNTKEFSFPLEIHPMSDSVLLLSYHHYDSLENKENVLTAIIEYDSTGNVQSAVPFSHFFDPDSVIGENAFPLYYAQRELCMQVTSGNCIVQLVREAPVTCQGKTGSQYASEVEHYFMDHNPVYKVRVAKLKSAGDEKSCVIENLGLTSYEGVEFTAEQLLSRKAVFVLNNPPQCHSCEESLLTALNDADTAACSIYVVFNNADTYLAKRDQIENVKKHLSVPFIPLFVPTKRKKEFLEVLGINTFPALLFKTEMATDAIVVSGEQIYGSNQSSALNQEFIRKISHFLTKSRYVRK